MRKAMRKIKRSINTSLLFFGISAFALLLIPFVQFFPDVAGKFISILIGILFWVTPIVGIVMFIRGAMMLSNFCKRNKLSRNLRIFRLPGIISFSVGIKHIVLYVLFIVGLGAIICDLIVGDFISEFLMFPIIAIVYFTFVVHCIIDGKIYKSFNLTKEGIDNVN